MHRLNRKKYVDKKTSRSNVFLYINKQNFVSKPDRKSSPVPFSEKNVQKKKTKERKEKQIVTKIKKNHVIFAFVEKKSL